MCYYEVIRDVAPPDEMGQIEAARLVDYVAASVNLPLAIAA